jgi:hypothetical protein
MRAILIDAANKIVKEIDLQPDCQEDLLESMYREIGSTILDLIRLDDHDLWLDEEGNEKVTPYGFSMNDADREHIFFGNGLILASAGDKCTPARWRVESVAEVVDFWSLTTNTASVH